MHKLKSVINIMKKLIVMPVAAVLAVIVFTSCVLPVTKDKDDNNPPTAPMLTISKVDKDSVSLAWSESFDDDCVEGYRVYKNGKLLIKLNETEYVDRDVFPGEEHEYYIVAYDRAGNRSSKSIKQSVKIPDDAALFSPSPSPASTPVQENHTDSSNIQKIARSTIKLYTLDDYFNIIAVGSGTIISDEGYILTNYHCIGDYYGLYNYDGYVCIALTSDIKKNIQPQYIAQYVAAEPYLDIAVVKIIADLNWNEVSITDLNLVPAIIGDSDTIKLGDVINILGYPAVGGETITFTAGHFSGFIDDDNDSIVDWIKTDAVVNHGNRGGTALNQKGEMVGIPTAKQIGADNDVLFYLKPINQAISIIQDAYKAGEGLNAPSISTPGSYPNEEYTDEFNTVDIFGRIVYDYTL